MRLLPGSSSNISITISPPSKVSFEIAQLKKKCAPGYRHMDQQDVDRLWTDIGESMTSWVDCVDSYPFSSDAASNWHGIATAAQCLFPSIPVHRRHLLVPGVSLCVQHVWMPPFDSNPKVGSPRRDGHAFPVLLSLSLAMARFPFQWLCFQCSRYCCILTSYWSFSPSSNAAGQHVRLLSFLCCSAKTKQQ
jgi:hypothetical protein